MRNLDAVQHFNTADDLRTQIVNARVWAGGLHYRFSGLAGVAPGTNVADYDLERAFQPDKYRLAADCRSRDVHGETDLVG